MIKDRKNNSREMKINYGNITIIDKSKHLEEYLIPTRKPIIIPLKERVRKI